MLPQLTHERSFSPHHKAGRAHGLACGSPGVIYTVLADVLLVGIALLLAVGLYLVAVLAGRINDWMDGDDLE